MKGVAILLTLTSHILYKIHLECYKIRNLSTLEAQKLLKFDFLQTQKSENSDFY